LLPNDAKAKSIEAYNGQIIVISSLGVYVYNASDGTLLSEITQREIAQKDSPVLKFSDISVLNYFYISQHNILSIHDCNNNGICDFVFIGKSDIYLSKMHGNFLAVSNLNLQVVQGSITWVYRTKWSWKINYYENAHRSCQTYWRYGIH